MNWGGTIAVLCTYRPYGEFGPRFRAAGEFTPEFGFHNRKEVDAGREELHQLTFDAVRRQVREHNACVEAWPT